MNPSVTPVRQTTRPDNMHEPEVHGTTRTLDSGFRLPTRIPERPVTRSLGNPLGRFRMRECPLCGRETMMRESDLRCSMCPPSYTHPLVIDGVPAHPVARVVDCRRLRDLRSEAGLSQEALGFEAGLTQTAVSRRERMGRCRIDVARRLAEALGVEVGDLAGESKGEDAA